MLDRAIAAFTDKSAESLAVVVGILGFLGGFAYRFRLWCGLHRVGAANVPAKGSGFAWVASGWVGMTLGRFVGLRAL